MELIITHENADFDAFASTVAARLLYPEATIALGRRVSGLMRDFLALHKDRFAPRWQSDIDQEAVTRVILVDVRRESRLQGWERLVARIKGGEVSLHVVDHHGASRDDLVGDWELIEPVGSATTLLIELMIQRGVAIDPIEATLMALGIYTDTGSLTFASTTARDARAAAWLLERGASLKMVNRYLSRSLSSDQRGVLSQMLGAVEVIEIGGVEVGFVTVALDKPISGLAEVTTQVLQLEGHDALFALFPIERKKTVQVIARARVPYIDVGEALKRVQGGGHPGAAAAAVKGGEVGAIKDALLEHLNADPPRPRVVMDVMTSPVHTVGPRTSLAEIREGFVAWRFTGVPVEDEGQVVGVISRRDIEAAERNGRLGLPASSCMSRPVKTISPESPLSDALDLMVEADIGRLPVVSGEGKRCVGIISRSDLLRILYGKADAREGHPTEANQDMKP